MTIKIYKHNQRGPRLETPALQELLNGHQPFVITSVPYDGRFKRHDYVFAELFDAVEPLLRGILFLDQDTDTTYFLKRGEVIFEPKRGIIQGPWHRDKFEVFANWYETTFSCERLRKEFESCGYCFR